VRRAVVTGIGAVTPVGLSGRETWENLLAGRSGIGPITRFDASNLPVRIAGEVKGFEPTRYMDTKAARRMSRFAQLAVAAAVQAAADAGVVIADDERERAAAAIATGAGGVLDTIAETQVLLERGPERISAFFIPTMAPNMGACQVAMRLGLRGPAMASVAACASGLYSFIEAKQLIERGIADVVFAGGTEAALHPLPIAALANMRALSRRNDAPEAASRPFDRDRDGFVFSEGAVVLAIESEERALRRGAHIYAELAGGGLSCDAYHITAPLEDGSGAAHAMAAALADAGIEPREVDCIVAHGTGTPLNDVAETVAIKTALGEAARGISVTAPKSMAGHLLGAAGALGALVAVMACAEDVVPPTINLEHPDPDCDLDYTPLRARPREVRAALANGFGFGGQNACVVFRKYRR
jgi:3-oxoacyl-[acyl-carrier-protein] synthase II